MERIVHGCRKDKSSWRRVKLAKSSGERENRIDIENLNLFVGFFFFFF